MQKPAVGTSALAEQVLGLLCTEGVLSINWSKQNKTLYFFRKNASVSSTEFTLTGSQELSCKNASFHVISNPQSTDVFLLFHNTSTCSVFTATPVQVILTLSLSSVILYLSYFPLNDDLAHSSYHILDIPLDISKIYNLML